MEGSTRFNYMIVNFRPGYRDRLAPLAKGMTISVACDVRGASPTPSLTAAS